MTTPAIGPTLISTIISRDANASATLWCDYLYQHRFSESLLSETQAEQWGYPALTGSKVIWLANELNEPWLRIIDSPEAKQLTPFTYYGWLSLEISVIDVDRLYEEIKDSPFEIIGEPANLDVSDNIRAMQAVGPDGEVLYLTEIKAPVPPFKLPLTRCQVDRLFIPVAMVPDRERATALYEQFEDTKSLKFDTKITVINKALGHKIDQRHPVATVQLAGDNLVELDEIKGLLEVDRNQDLPSTGISMISFEVPDLPASVKIYTIEEQPYRQRRSCILDTGSEECLELIARL